jgi:hypothetical protein
MRRFNLTPLLLGLLTAIAIALTGCPSNTTPETDGGDGDTGDPDAIVCASRDDCPDPANYECQGVCLQLCASDDVCPATQFCDDGFCRAGCRAGTCPDDQICVAGSCMARDAANTCGSKCDCDPGEICADGVCQDPPAECNSSDDCGRGPGDECTAYACNGFTKQCFYPNAPDCEGDSDCEFRPGCEGGCTCAPSGLCISSAACTEETEADDCGPGAYCTADLTCDALPACSVDADCAEIGMVCNTLSNQCERPNPCASDAECTDAPATFCDLAFDPARCVVPTCMNGGVICGADEICNPGTGACDPDGAGGDVCVSNADCSNAPWPDTEYCSVPFGQTMGNCVSGCQNNLSCPQGQSCNGAHQCVAQGGDGDGDGDGDGSAGSSCADISECQVGLICHLLEGTCQETCGDSGAPCDPATDSSCCALTGYSQCNPGLIFSFCTP